MSNEVLVKQGNKAEWGEYQGSSQADWNQNDESAPSYVKNRPFYEIDLGIDAMTITWDGNTDGHEITQLGAHMYLCKVSDVILPIESFDGATMKSILNGSATTINLSIAQGNIMDGSSQGMPIVVAICEDYQLFIYAVQEDTTLSGLSLTAGIYFMYGTDNTGAIIRYVQELNTIDAIRLTQIEEKFMPDTVKNTVNTVKNIEFETWTFELEDGSTLDKKVVVQS